MEKSGTFTDITGALRKAVSVPGAWIAGLMTAGVLFGLSVALPNLRLIVELLGSASLGLEQKAVFLGAVAFSFVTNFTTTSQIVIVLTVVLGALNVMLLVALLRSREPQRSGTTLWGGAGGTAASMLGIGCASCGSILLTGAFPVFGAALAGVLPFAGMEFGLFGVGILGYTALRTTRRMSAPLICPPKSSIMNNNK